MDETFEQNIIKQDSTLCKIPPEILKIILECLSPNDVVHLSHTCKELHKKLPFYLKKSGRVTFLSKKMCFFLEGPVPNFSINEINISVTAIHLVRWVDYKIAVWIQIIRSGIVVLETQKYFLELTTDGNLQIRIKDTTLKEYKGGGRLRFIGMQKEIPLAGDVEFRFQVSLQLENYKKCGKRIDTTKKLKGYADFKSPSVSLDIEDACGHVMKRVMMLPKECELQLIVLRCHALSLLPVEKGNTNF